MKKFAIFFLLGKMLLGEEETPPLIIPAIPLIPASPIEKVDENLDVWELEKMTTLMMENRLQIVVPLEIISDLDVKALIIDDQKLEIPFEIEMNKEPDRKDYYMLKYTATELDIDDDGSMDTRIYSPKYINKKVVDDNLLTIDGANISREGTHKKRVYVTVELKDVRK